MTDAGKGIAMEDQPKPARRNNAGRDGLAALAVMLLAAALIAVVIHNLIP